MEQNFTTADRYSVRYLENGVSNKKHVLCLHGLGASAERWSKVLPILAKEYHVVAPDLIGFGYSDKPEVHYTIDFLVRFVRKFMKKMQLKKVILVGASLGGHIALETALAYGDTVEKLVLVSPAGMMKNPTPGLSHYIAAAMYPTVENARKAFQEMAGSKDVDEIYTKDFVNRMQLPYAKYAFMSAVLGSRAAPALEDRLHKIKVPTLIVWGKKDGLIPVKFARKFHAYIKDSKLVIMDNCGHTPYFEKPNEFCNILLEFLKN
ncbi:MAG: alpha/beta hydrolase [Nitrososphaerales archaeon]